MNISICIATYGDPRWRDLAMSRAYPSALEQGAYEVIPEHHPFGSIATARNYAAARATGDWLVFLDADDELTAGYLSAIEKVWIDLLASWSNAPLLLTPQVSYVTNGRAAPPKFWDEKPLWEGNWLVIGTAIKKSLFDAIGGFEQEIHGFEDWSLFARADRAGARIVKVPEAIYRAHVDPKSRNRKLAPAEALYWHQRIGANVFPERYEQPTAEEHRRHLLLNGERFARQLRLRPEVPA